MPQPIAIWNTARDAWEEPGTESLLCGHLAVSSGTFPTSGSMRSGEVYALPTWEPAMAASESSSLPPDGVLTDAYMAGIMDGEGCIRIARERRTFSVHVELGMSYKALPLLKRVHLTYGGSLIRSKRDDRTNTRAECWSWRITNAKSIDFLKLMLPHLVIKKEQAALAIRFHETVKPMPRGSGRGAPWSDLQKALGEAAFVRMRELNRVGPERPANDSGDIQLLLTPVASEGTKPSNTMGVARRKATGEVFLTNQIVSLCGLDPSEAQVMDLLPTPRTSDTNGPGLHGTGGMDLRTAATLLPTTTAMDYKMSGGAEGSSNVTLTDALVRGRGLLPTPTVGNADGTNERRGGSRSDELLLPGAAKECMTDWGPYEPAIRRWERVLGRLTPSPTEPNAKGNHRLSPRFTEFLMGVPEGWITDIPISRNEQLKACGNGVVPQQAAAALGDMLAAFGEAP